VFAKFSEFFMCWGFPQNISRQDRLGATISNSVDPRIPAFVLLQTHFAFSELIAAVSGSRAGLLIQTSLGRAGGLGALRTKRSG
jgi:hypothetical protein